MRKRLLPIALLTTAILLIPLIAMQFTDEVNWGLMDFLIAAFLLLSTGIILDLIRKKAKHSIRKILFVIVLLIFILIWIELAVGILGTPFSGD